ncbi:MAG: CCA tRNA nucleotidyltransferase [Chloroflexota bacterium]|nr:CCA tRNA nucleotidyltransferase [Chloroflexota bacterium]
MAQLPLLGRPVEAQLSEAERLVLGDLPQPVVDLLARLVQQGHVAVLVGGCLRDLLRGVEPNDWDVATSAPPEAVAALFPGASWENRFGTVTVLEPIRIEVTTFRVEGRYRDRRRPDEVRWGSSVEEDLARRDFTMNAVAWLPTDLESRAGRLVDPFSGAADLRAGLLRAVGEPERRFEEDALRLLRAVRFAACLDLQLDPQTAAAIRALAPTASSVSGERVRDELVRILACGKSPSVAFALMEKLGLLPVLFGELAALRGIPQGKALAGDALEHSLRTVDALPPSDPILRLAGLLHDLGKATTMADGHFTGHEQVGADLAEALMRRLRFGKADIERAAHLVREHMFGYTPEWTDAAVRRFVRRVGAGPIDDLFALREADAVASGGEVSLDELRRRVAAEVGTPIEQWQLAIDGNDLQRRLGLGPGPLIGLVLGRLLDSVLEQPSRNEPEELLRIAREMLTDVDSTQRVPGTKQGDSGELQD